MPSSDFQLRQDDLNSSSAMAKTGSSTPCSKLPSNLDIASKFSSESRRKALADLPGNGSPVCGLIPLLPGSETPSNLKSALKSCRAMYPQVENSVDLSSTPLGENLLRSQVQLLLQKVEPNVPTNKQTPSLRSLCLMHSFSESPGLRLAAPTPLNTPCATNPLPECPQNLDSKDPPVFLHYDLVLQHNAPSGGVILSSQPKSRDTQDSGMKLCVDLEISPKPSVSTVISDVESCLKQTHIKISESVSSGNDNHVVQLTPLIVDSENEAGASDGVLGTTATRILEFSSPEKGSMIKNQDEFERSLQASSVHELEDDEVSDWSVLVNVSSPEAKDDSLHQSLEGTVSSFDEHLQRKNHDGNDEDKVNFLWSNRRKVLQSGTHLDESQDAEQDPYQEYSEDVEEEWEDDEFYESAYHSDLCDSFNHMTMDGEEERKPLPEGQGKHIRFVYQGDNDDEIKEEVVEAQTKNGQASDGGMHLRGLPAPTGKHLRFSDASSEGMDS